MSCSGKNQALGSGRLGFESQLLLCNCILGKTLFLSFKIAHLERAMSRMTKLRIKSKCEPSDTYYLTSDQHSAGVISLLLKGKVFLAFVGFPF